MGDFNIAIIITCIGLVVTAVLSKKNVKGSILIGIVAELTEPLRELYVMAYSLPSIAAYLYKSTTKRLQVIFGPYLPEAQPKDFYEMEIASASIMRGFMSVPCDVYFTMDAKISRFLDCSLKLYDVPKEKRAAITAAVLQMDLHTMALGIIQKTVRQAEKGFDALTEKQI